MPRLTRLPPVPFGWYYVALRSVANRMLVSNQAELMTELHVLRGTMRARGARLHAAYLAECELHLVLQTSERPLKSIIAGFAHEYARRFNRAHRERGPLFRPHHHVLLIQQQRWLVPLVHFIHWIRRLEAPNDYVSGVWWSSDALYRGKTKHDWITTNVVLRMLCPRTDSSQVREEAYRARFERMPNLDYVRLFKQASAEDPRLLGDSDFIRDAWRNAGRRLPSGRRRWPANGTSDGGDIPGAVTQVIKRFCALCELRLPRRQAVKWQGLLTIDIIRSRSRKRPLPMVRALCGARLIADQIATPAQVAGFFGCSARSISARRRRYYEAMFGEWFGDAPEVLLGAP